MKRSILLLIAAITPFIVMAQNNKGLVRAKIKREFKIDDLIPGGETYYSSSVPERVYTAWWGERCVLLDQSECTLIDDSGQPEQTPLFTLADINRILGSEGFRVSHFYYAEFPYPEKTVVRLKVSGAEVLVDWKACQIICKYEVAEEAQASLWSPESKMMAIVKDHNLCVVDENGKSSVITADGSSDIVYGQSVHRNEFGIESGLFWSPDGSRLAFYRMDQSMVSAYPQVNLNTDGVEEGKSRCAVVKPDRYPMAGETSHKVAIGIYDATSGKTIYLNTGDPTDRYFTNIAWAPDGKTIYLIELDRAQKHSKLDAYNPETGDFVATLLNDDNDKYVEPLHPIQFLPWDSNRFIYQTRRDGYNHIDLYKLTNDGATLERQLTKGNYEVIELLGFNEKEKSIVYASNEANPIGCAIYVVNMKGATKPLGNTEGWHKANLSPAGTRLMDAWALPEGEVAHRQDIVNTASGNITTVIDSPDPWDNFNVPEIKVGTIKAADGTTDLYYRLVLPTDFDPQKKYPAVVYVYGGPHAHMVDASRHWGVRGWDVWMAQKGYVMFSLDNRGSEHRGLEFEQATFRNLGVNEMADQVKGVEFLKSLGYVDPDRIGVHGWSFGGFMTTSLMTTYPDLFKVGVAGGPVIDWKFYEVMYGERYMETPQSNPEGYKQASCLDKAKNLKGRLLIIYGGNDPVCVPQHTLSFIRACIDADTYPDLFTYPGDEHNMLGTDRVHLHKLITRYFDDHLK